MTTVGASILPVAKKDRHAGRLTLIWLWAGGNILLATFIVGSSYSESLGFWPMVVVSITANLAAYGLCAFSSQRASKYGIDEMISLRPAFGVKGSHFGVFVLIFVNFGWIGLLSSMTGTAAQNVASEIMGQGFSFKGDYSIYALSGGIVIPLILIMSNPKSGFHLSKITVPVLTAFSIYVLFKLISTEEYLTKALEYEPTHELGWAFAFELCIAWAVAWQPYVFRRMK